MAYRGRSGAHCALARYTMFSRKPWKPISIRLTLKQRPLCYGSDRFFSSLGPRWTAHSVLAKHGLGTDWLTSQKLTLHDCNGRLYSKRLGYHQREIRLLYIMPSADPTSTVEMVMVHCSLDNHPPYKALSYTWGNPFSSPVSPRVKALLKTDVDPWDKTATVFVNDVAFTVKRNLIDAIHRFRATHAKKAIWVDSICINQADPIECGQEVRLMDQVYGTAEEVPIWLGKKNTGVNTAFHLVKDVNNAFAKWYDTQHHLGYREQWDRIVQTGEAIPNALDQANVWEWLQSPKCRPFFDNIDFRALGVRTDRLAWEFLRSLLSRTWFDRVWTWQEKELARKATVYVGDKTLPWVELWFAMLLVMGHDLSETRVTPSLMMPNREYLRVMDSLNIATSSDLLDIVMIVRHRNTSDPRDKIFGVVGVAARYHMASLSDQEQFLELVKYGYLATNDVYKEFSRYWILEKRDLRVLQACRPYTKMIKELPSWVVDWSDNTQSWQLSTRLYNASKGQDTLDVDYQYHLNSDELRIKGVSIDRVKFVFTSKSIDKDELKGRFKTGMADAEYWRSRLMQPLVSLYVAGIGRNHTKPLPTDWKEAIQNLRLNDIYLPTGQSQAEAFWRTLILDQCPYITDSTNRRVPSDIDLVSIFNQWAHIRALPLSLLPESMRDRKEVGVSVQRWLEAIGQRVLNKRFYVTERGYIGSATKHIQANDRICIFFGGKVPFALRKKEDAEWYTLVEEAYLHGFMDGESIDLLEKGELEEEWFNIR